MILGTGLPILVVPLVSIHYDEQGERCSAIIPALPESAPLSFESRSAGESQLARAPSSPMNIRNNTQSSQLVGAMLEPDFYPHAPPSVELRETHISWVFLAGKLAYKVKKPLTLPFLDYGTVERRHQMCREEVRLNRRLAPQIYLAVVAVARSRDRYTLRPEADPAAVEYAVEMRRVEEGRSLAALATRGELRPAHVTAAAGLSTQALTSEPSLSGNCARPSSSAGIRPSPSTAPDSDRAHHAARP